MKPRNLIPKGWELHHRPILEGSFTAVCELRGPQGAYDYETGGYEPGELLSDNVPCRVQRQAEGRGGQPSGLPVDTRDLQITLPIDRVPELDITDDGPFLTVTGFKPGHAGDPQLIGKKLRVTNAQYGSLAWERVLTATTEV